ncbi:MAG: hypothetical protein H6R19_355 [Proteobacteria bacterium]|nr:hypothetical protein [Pseudomonadota bacterium]
MEVETFRSVRIPQTFHYLRPAGDFLDLVDCQHEMCSLWQGTCLCPRLRPALHNALDRGGCTRQKPRKALSTRKRVGRIRHRLINRYEAGCPARKYLANQRTFANLTWPSHDDHEDRWLIQTTAQNRCL